MKKQHFLLITFFLTALLSCEKEEVTPTKIFPGEGIDKVKIGDSKTEVLNQLGDNEISSFSGSYTNYQTNTIIYFKNYWASYDNLGITVYLNGDNQSVSGISLYEPYDGKSQDKIGIGSNKDDVVKNMGEGKLNDGYYEYPNLGIDFKYDNSNSVERIYIY